MKSLVEVAGRPFLDWKLGQLAAAGATEFHLLVAHGADEIRDHVGPSFDGILVRYHHDDGIGQRAAHDQAALPFLHWLTYGDCLLDVPLRHSLYPYVYVNDEHPADAGVTYCWGRSFRALPRSTTARSYHLNTPADLAECEAYLEAQHGDLGRHRGPR